MNVEMLTKWALNNAFVAIDDRHFASLRQDRKVQMGIKKQSVVFIVELSGRPPRILSRQFKDLKVDAAHDVIEGLPPFEIDRVP
jgi:hypothetical protein